MDEAEQPEPEASEETIGDLVARLVDDGRAYAAAEFDLYRTIAEHRAERAQRAVIILAIGWFLLIAAMSALTISAMIALSLTIGPLLAGVVVGLPMGLLGYGLARYGWAGMKGLKRDGPERAAIARGKDAP
ncbi:MAG: phage holin family protein [Sphingomonas sp.]